jgi:AbiV family abortive infection protein
MAVTPEFLLKGAAYALEQCGLLLRDADMLYRVGSYANAVVLTAFAREEFGRSNILLDLRKRALAGEAITTGVIAKACDDHVKKQRAGMAGLTMRDRDSGLARLIRARSESHPESEERRKLDTQLKQIGDAKTKRTGRTCGWRVQCSTPRPNSDFIPIRPSRCS